MGYFKIKFPLVYLVPLFVLTFSILTIAYIELPNSQTTDQNTLILSEFDGAYPFDIQTSAITTNGTHVLFFGGENDSWVAHDNVFSVNMNSLDNLNSNNFNSSQLFINQGKLPYPAYNMGMVRTGSTIYLIGGVNVGVPIKNILKCDISNYPYQFTSVHNLTYGLENPKVIRLGQMVYIFGGSNGPIGDLQKEVFSFNLTDNSLTDLHIQAPIYSPNVRFYNNKIYLIGGVADPTNSIYSNNVYIFNPETLQFTKVMSLPYNMDISQSYLQNNKLIIFNRHNTTSFTNDISVFDLFSKQSKRYKLDSNFDYTDIANSQRFISDNVNAYLFGGSIYPNITRVHSIFKINLSKIFGDQILTNGLNNKASEVVNNASTFTTTSTGINYSFKNTLSQYIDPIQPVTLNLNDSISIRAKYFDHNDTNTRQRVEIGFTDGTPIKPVDLANTLPSENFIGIHIQNVNINNTSFVFISARVVSNNVSVLNQGNLFQYAVPHDILFRFTKLNDTSFYYSLAVDQFIECQVINSNLNNLKLNSFAIWNENNSFLSLQGSFNGQVDSISFIHTEPLKSNQNLKDLIGLFLFFNLFLIAILIYVIRSPKFKYLATGSKPDGIPNSLINLGYYNLYRTLKKAFEKLEKISRVSLEEDPDNLRSQFNGKFAFLSESEEFLIDESGLEDMTGLSMRILIHLLDYLDHGTYLTNVQVNLDISRSSFYYTINKLKEKGLITINTTITDDQRKKFVVISPKGYSLLRLVYNHLDNYFNDQK